MKTLGAEMTAILVEGVVSWRSIFASRVAVSSVNQNWLAFQSSLNVFIEKSLPSEVAGVLERSCSKASRSLSRST